MLCSWLSFFDLFTSLSYYPKITFPTRFSRDKRSLLDNVFCRLSTQSLKAYPGILLKQFSDHQPYFLSLDISPGFTKHEKYITVYNNSPEHIQLFLNELSNLNEINKINTNPFSNPNTNYNTLNGNIEQARKKHLSSMTVKFNKHKDKRSPWITQGIIKSIKFRDKLHRKLKKTPRDNPQYICHKLNLNTYNKILK